MLNLSGFDIYFIIINIIGFIAFAINSFLYNHTQYDIDDTITIISVLGGSPGILLSILIFYRLISKEIMMSRVFVICVSIIQILLFVMFKAHFESISISIWNLFTKNKILLIYLCIINFITFAIFALDKVNALQDKWRYRIITLLGLCFIGGSVGGLLAMYIYRHKTKQSCFVIGVPLIIVTHIIICFFIYNLTLGNISI